MKLLAIDPGNTQSAYVLLDVDSEQLIDFGKVPNSALISRLRNVELCADHMAIERIAMGGMAAGVETFDTAEWVGRYLEAWESRGAAATRIRRYDEKVILCGTVRAKDKNIRQALIDRFGGIAETKKGGRLYKVSADVWSALAVAVTWKELQRETRAA